MKSDFRNILYTFFRNLEDCVLVWRGRRRKKGGLLTNIFVVFQCKIHLKCMKKRDVCVELCERFHKLELLLFFWTISMQFQRKKKKNAVNLILCTSFFIILFNFKFMSWFNWAKICQQHKMSILWAMKLRVIWFFFCSFEARDLLSTNSSLSKNYVLLSILSSSKFFWPLAQNSSFKNHLYLKDYSIHIRSIPRSLPITDNLKFPSFVLEFRNAWNANIYARSSFLPYSKV